MRLSNLSVLRVYELTTLEIQAGEQSGRSAGATYRVEFKTNLAAQSSWTPLASFTLSASSLLLSNTLPAGNGTRLYRAVLVP